MPLKSEPIDIASQRTKAKQHGVADDQSIHRMLNAIWLTCVNRYPDVEGRKRRATQLEGTIRSTPITWC